MLNEQILYESCILRNSILAKIIRFKGNSAILQGFKLYFYKKRLLKTYGLKLKQENHIFVFKPKTMKKLILDELNRKKDRKSTRLNSSHVRISYAVFCL